MCGIDDAAILDFETHEVLPPCPAELAWREQVQMLANSFAIYLVQLMSTGERGLLLVSEYSHQGSAVEEGLGSCDRWAAKEKCGN